MQHLLSAGQETVSMQPFLNTVKHARNRWNKALMHKFKRRLPWTSKFNFLTPLQTNLSMQQRCFYNIGKHDAVWHTWDQRKRVPTHLTNKTATLELSIKFTVVIDSGLNKHFSMALLRKGDMTCNPASPWVTRAEERPPVWQLWKA